MAMFLADGGYDVVESRRAGRSSTGRSTTSTSSTRTTSSPTASSRTTRIYGFRGADIRNILEFEDDFPDAHVVKLEQNYRSTQTILSRRQRGGRATTGGARARRCGPTSAKAIRCGVRELSDEHAEARFVAAEVQRMVDEGVSRNEIAVFYRTNAQSRVLEDMLVRAQIGYQVIGGTKFYDRAEIKDAIAT